MFRSLFMAFDLFADSRLLRCYLYLWRGNGSANGSEAKNVCGGDGGDDGGYDGGDDSETTNSTFQNSSHPHSSYEVSAE